MLKCDGGQSSNGFHSEDLWPRVLRSENIFRAHDQALTSHGGAESFWPNHPIRQRSDAAIVPVTPTGRVAFDST